MHNLERVFQMSFASVYPHYVAKVQKKGRTEAELQTVIQWLTGYSSSDLEKIGADRTNFRDFFAQAPFFNPNASKITGSVCGVKVQEISDPLMQKIRFLDKLVDELAQGKSMEKILRT